MAKLSTPVKVKRGDNVREAANLATLNQLLWDGFTRVDDAPLVTEEEVAELTPQQKAAVTRKANAAAKKAEDEAGGKTEDETPAGQPAASGNTAEGETTVGNNPS